MKTMTIDELKERGLKTGDIYYASFKELDTSYDGWYLVLEDIAVGLNTRLSGTWRYKNECGSISKIILSENLLRDILPTNISRFFKSFDEDLVKNIITNITKKEIVKYVHAVHFGSAKPYTWRVPKALEKVNFTVGDIVEVDTIHGKQYVQVKETAEYEYDEKTKEVTGLVKTEDLPF